MSWIWILYGIAIMLCVTSYIIGEVYANHTTAIYLSVTAFVLAITGTVASLYYW